MLVAVIGCAQEQAKPAEKPKEKEKVQIGLATPLTGASAQDGLSCKKGADLAVKLINAAGGISGKELVLVTLDDKTDPKEAASVAQKFVVDKNILGVAGHYNSSCTLAGIPIYNEGKLAHISTASSAPTISGAGKYTFRLMTPNHKNVAPFLAKWMVDDEKYKKIVILYEQSDFGKTLEEVVSKELKAKQASILASIPYVPGQTVDFSAAISEIKRLKPECVFMAGLYNETALFLTQFRQAGMKTPVMGQRGTYAQPLITLGKEYAEGVTAISYVDPDRPKYKEFEAAYLKEYKVPPATYDPYGFDAVMILAEAIKKVGADRDKIRQFLDDLAGYDGAVGATGFDAEGDPILTTITKMVVKDGKFVKYTK
jgi:branched-chain amino acid transport system substrate-binding protein